jgi:hypothetical protein
MQVETLKNRITRKFGSITKFCKASGVNYIDLYNLFRQQDTRFKRERLKDLHKKVKETPVISLDGIEITPELLEKIRVSIRTKYNTYQQFCTEHGVSNTWLSALLNGKHVLISNRVKNLCRILNISYNAGSK